MWHTTEDKGLSNYTGRSRHEVVVKNLIPLIIGQQPSVGLSAYQQADGGCLSSFNNGKLKIADLEGVTPAKFPTATDILDPLCRALDP